MPSQRVQFLNQQNLQLAGILELPETPVAFAIFCHCFTCTKDLKAIVKISRQLAQQDIAVLRFDFTGLGNSKGNFSDTTFDNNLDDVQAALRFLAEHYEPAKLFIGHSLGGAALMYTCPDNLDVLAIATLASPSSTQHLANFLASVNPDIVNQGEGDVEIGGRTYRLKKELIENLKQIDLESAIRRIQVPHLIMHPPEDDTLPFWHAEKLFELTSGPKSFLTLEHADHLLVNHPSDVPFVADSIGRWFQHVLDRHVGA